MTRAAIYARFSSDKQSEASAEDQARLCQQRAEREGWQVVGVYPDLALSGASRDRPGLNTMLEHIERFDVVLAESIDRISRDQEDIANIWKRLRFAGVRLVTLSEGEVSEIHVGVGGTMAALYLRQLGEKTRRGQLGRVEAGRIPGGLSYGYALVPAVDARGRPDRGQRRIDDAQANVVRRIFAEFMRGKSPKAIALGLNRDSIPSPSGRPWGASTIYGNRHRGTGILHNELYIGRIVYNRQRFEKHPETRKRVAKLNPREEWKVAEVPALAIVDQATWDGVQERFARLEGVPAHQQRRAKLLFSGLVKCGCCDGGFTIVTSGRWGCSGNRNGRGCSNSATISNKLLEGRILDALKHKMLAPDVVSEFVREYHQLMAEDRAKRLAERATVERQLARAEQRLERFANAIGAGADFAALREKVQQASEERDRAAVELAELEALPVIVMHPGIADVYRRQVADLVEALNADRPGTDDARAKIRALVDGIIATPNEDGRGVALDLQGRLATILALTQKTPILSDRGTLKLVAGAGFTHQRILTRVAA
jgi:site-specific DNA recombinase